MQRVFSKASYGIFEKDYTENAIEFYTRAIDIEPDYGNSLLITLVLCILMVLNDVERAKPCFEAALKLNDDYTMAHFNMARCYEMQGDKVLAANEYQAALDLNKLYPEIDDNIIQERGFLSF